jgi:hypothetical protein
MTSILIATSTIGVITGQGIYGFLHENLWAYIGLVQAYWLMAAIGLSLWIGAAQVNPRPWHLIGALAHVVPIALNIIFYNLIASSGIGNAALLGLTFHCVSSIAEIVAGFNLVGHPKPAQAVGQ